MTSASRYHVGDLIYASSNSRVFRGYRIEDGLPVVCKVMQDELPSPERRARFQQEYELMHQLSADGIAKAHSLEPYQRSRMLVVEDFGGASLDRLAVCGTLPLDEWLRLAIRITECLAQLHGQHVMHKDINPSNIVWNRQSGVVKLIDLGNATKLSREVPEVRNPERLEGTLFYLSPEQTGRMNRAMDYRTDFYSLGVTFYELLTGQLPFMSDDALELVHAHIARFPVPAHQVKPGIPAVLSDMIGKLMAKTAEGRYQSAAGLKADLQRCLDTLDANGHIPAFRLGEHDFSGRFQIPQKLYGRGAQLATLLDAFGRASQGPAELLLVSGFSGIGKSALVHEVQKPIVQRRGYFIEGKFDQLKRDIPYAAFTQAFDDLIRQLLTEDERLVAAWKARLLQVLGGNVQIIVDVIPNLERIIGPQPPVLDLPPSQAQARFNHEFTKFVGAFASIEHPLVIFLDDLQWADLASLQLIALILRSPAMSHLLMMGAYRDNEITPTHPFSLQLEEMARGEVPIQTITLQPLDLDEVNSLLCDTLQTNASQVAEFAQLCLAKTQGNPFFLNQFLATLVDRNMLRPDLEHACWQWDMDSIQQAGITDNIAELMVARLHKLPQASLQILREAACLGNVFDLATLSTVCRREEVETARLLWDALMEELVVPLDGHYKYALQPASRDERSLLPSYRFLHDRVQQAAYMLSSATEKAELHLAIGRLWLRTYSDAELQGLLFDLVNHLNLGRSLITERTERLQLARLNLAASHRAKASAAYKPALNFLQAALDMVSDDDWGNEYELMFALHLGAAEAAYLCIDPEQMERYVRIGLDRANDLLDQAKVHEIRIQAHINRYEFQEAITSGLAALRLLGLSFPKKPSQVHILLSLLHTKRMLAGKTIDDLARLPDATDPAILVTRRILSKILSAAYYTQPAYFPLFLFKAIRLSLKHGHAAPTSAIDFAAYGMILSGVLGDIQQGDQYGKLALLLLERPGMSSFRCRTNLVIHTILSPWTMPVHSILEPAKQDHLCGMELGDIEFAINSAKNYCFYAFYCGNDLLELERETGYYLSATKNLWLAAEQAFEVLLQAYQNLKGLSPNPAVLRGQVCDERKISEYEERAYDQTFMFQWSSVELVVSFLFRDYRGTLRIAEKAEKYLEGAVAFFGLAVYYLYSSLALLAVLDSATSGERRRALRKVGKNQKKLLHWAKHTPSNFLNKWTLVEAELARHTGDKAKAAECYERAIRLAHENRFLSEEALANELAGEFHFKGGNDFIARAHFQEALRCYRVWGAEGKVNDLIKRYPQWLAEHEARFSIGTRSIESVSITSTSSSGTLDLATIMKASQALSQEIVLERLLKRLIEVAIENAGAQRGVLILRKEGKWFLEAEKLNGQAEATVLQSILLDESRPDNVTLPLSLVHYVARTQEGLVIHDAMDERLLAHDVYVRTCRPRSLLIVPIFHHGEMTGLLYLENNAATGAFTANRLEVLHVLASQAAISIENARLYANMEERVAARTAELALSAETLRQLGDVGRAITASLDADAIFEALHRHIGVLLDMSAMAIYRGNPDGITFDPVFARQDGHALPERENMLLAALARSVPRVASERQELLVEVNPESFANQSVAGSPQMLTSLFSPLVVDDRLLGVMLIQSRRAQAYGDRERMIFRALCAYGAIALDNAATYRHLEATLRTLNQTQSELLERNGELARVNKLLEEQQSELTRFLAVASHDLRQPMHSLNLYLGALSNYELPMAARPVLANVSQCAQIMDDMFLALLDLSRLDAQMVAPHIEHFPIASLLSRIAVEFAPQAKDKGLELRVAPCSVWVQSDPALVEQILRNFTANAVRYTERGGIVIGCRRRGAQLRLAVFDTGIGIAADQQKSVFEEFCQIGNAGRDRTKGLGLGLAIVRRLARLLDTPITLESVPGKGSMFAIDLQRIDPFQSNWQRKPLWTTVLDIPAGSMQDRLAGKLVVVVDDEISILDAMRVLLEQWGCTVVTALSGREALASLSLSMRAPDILICDYRLRLNENGLDVIRMLQSEFNLDIPVLIITGTITPARMKEITLSGVPVLHKPVNAASLRKSLLQIVERH